MRGGKNKQPLGYTIIEVMIVLAVSGVMFVIAAGFINGKQEKTSFTEGANEMAQQIQDVIEQVTDGRYSDIPVNCTPAASGDPTNKQTFSGGGNGIGTNQGCIFVGKFMHFDEKGGWSDDTIHYEIFSLAGNRNYTTTGGTLSQNNNLIGTHPEPVQSLWPAKSPSVDLTLQSTTPQSLKVTSVSVHDNDAKSPHNGHDFATQGFGFIQTLGNYDGTGGGTSGAQSLELIYSPNLAPPNDSTEIQAVQKSSQQSISASDPGAYASAASATICMTDGVQYAHINVGSVNNGSTLSVNVDRSVSKATC